MEGVRYREGLFREEMDAVKWLVDRGEERKPRLLALQRSVADNVGKMGSFEANIASVKENIEGIQLQIADLKAQRAEDNASRLAEILTNRRQVEESDSQEPGPDRAFSNPSAGIRNGVQLPLQDHRWGDPRW